MTSKVKSTKSGTLRELTAEDASAWERRNAAAIRKALAKSWKDHKDGKGIALDPRDPYAVIRNARKKYGTAKKVSA